jgi:hypothetical protein
MNETEEQNREQILTLLEPHFDLYREVWLRDPLTSLDMRIDVLAVPREEDFPFDPLGVEVKRSNPAIGHRTQAFKQAIDYRRCVLNDQRLKSYRCAWVPAVAVYMGGPSYRLQIGDPDRELVRLAGKFNVGLFVRHRWSGLQLEICGEPIWNGRYGTTETGLRWPVERRVGNSRRRVA